MEHEYLHGRAFVKKSKGKLQIFETPAGDRYGIRYEEALALECAYQRWRLAQIEARL
jgi:hypothetical protein